MCGGGGLDVLCLYVCLQRTVTHCNGMLDMLCHIRRHLTATHGCAPHRTATRGSAPHRTATHRNAAHLCLNLDCNLYLHTRQSYIVNLDAILTVYATQHNTTQHNTTQHAQCIGLDDAFVLVLHFRIFIVIHAYIHINLYCAC